MNIKLLRNSPSARVGFQIGNRDIDEEGLQLFKGVVEFRTQPSHEPTLAGQPIPPKATGTES
jgi:hypothetical protein